MYIIVVGGGKVGYYLTKTLVHEGYEVFLIEKNPIKCQIYAERCVGPEHATGFLTQRLLRRFGFE